MADIRAKAAAGEKIATPAKPQDSTIAPARNYPDYRSITLPPLTGQTDLNGFHALLFGCAPQNLINLTPEERAQCKTEMAREKPDDFTADHAGPSHAKDPEHWARALMRRQQPTLLPCFPPGIQTPGCLATGLTSGFDLDNQPGYGDMGPPIHVPNNGDPPDGPPK